MISPKSTVCIATAGSGKTRWLTSIAADLSASKIPFIAFTFTRAASAELRSRINLSVSSSSWIGTIHSFAYRLITDTFNSSPFDNSSSSSSSSVSSGKTILNFSSLSVDSKLYYDVPNFTHMMEKATSLLKRNPSVLKSLVASYPVILLDEAQDLDSYQFSLIELLCEAGCVLYEVGDPMQCIYSFAGAHSSYMSFLSSKFNLQSEALITNYRSTRQIVACANEVSSRQDEGTFDGVEVEDLIVDSVQDFPSPEQFTFLVRDRYLHQFTCLGAEWIFWKKNNEGKYRTIHSSKGLEFDKVALLFPRRHLLGYNPAERNVFYVGVTRAKTELKVLRIV